jgi:hypothetical protein
MAWSSRTHRFSPLLLPLVVAFACNGDDGDTAASTSTTGPTTGLTTGTTTESGGTETASTTGSGSDSDSDSTTAATESTTGGTETDTATTGGTCAAGEIVCDGDTAKTCDGDGGFTSEEACDSACAPGLGCVACVPGSGQCDGDVSQVCNEDGSAYVDAKTCDDLQGLSCDADSGFCVGPCASLGTSYIGCDYYPVVTPQLDNFIDDNPYAVAIANTADEVATVTITQGDGELMSVDVAAGSVELVTLPWVDDLVLGNGPSTVAIAGAYRLRSTQPVTVYQYNPLEADITNDASLMLPVNTWTGEYVVAAWPFLQSLGNAGFYSVTASEDGTTVDVTPPGGGTPTQAGGGVDAQGSGQVTLDAGDVLQVFVAQGGDPTGTIVSADKPVQVMAGHECTQVPIGTNACDHLEESMFPVETLAKEYIVAPPVQVPDDSKEKAVVVRVVATQANTTLTFEPDQGVNTSLANAGDFVEIPPTTEKFVVSADKKIVVAEYMVGQGGGYGTSDPAMLLAVPSAQYRTDYLFFAETGWSANYVDVIAPDGAAVEVDGSAVGDFTPIADSGFSIAHVLLSNAGDGAHSVSADQKVGISVYGVLNFGSYWYPGGLDLELIPQ